ncbi:pimeloyl-ACP methyl ester carboxylesterase [Streptomyces sp. V4I23]|uniref:alpha/beta fold hydrolase n=1 Tax=Streptomyces sp. V4I23 TaxID=3042282 RepID=UPI00278567C5|nr:alpha/beta hydrolase [Streptomyces sp. V4I23]MDQ1005676.1 pimeloyl-ACP methyl ester carboxylesterase [Streptomyces sp. V4I23]
MPLINVNGIGINVQDVGEGPAVLLIHGWPDTHQLWQRQVPALTSAGFRVISLDLRGFGESDKPLAAEDYALTEIIGDLIGVLDHLNVDRAHLVGHDWGGVIATLLAALQPTRVNSLTCLAVGHPQAFVAAGWSQREKSWYMLLFQFAGVAEQWLSQNDFANLRAWSRHPDADEVIARLRDPAALTASLGVYRAVFPPESYVVPGGPVPPLPPIEVPTMGVWGAGELFITEEALTATAEYTTGSWRYERIDTGHWMPLEAPEETNRLLLDFLGGAETKAA